MPGELGKVFVWRMKLTPPREQKERKRKKQKTKTLMQFLLCISTGYKLPQVTLVALSRAYTRG